MKNTIKNNKNYHFTFLAFTAMTLFFGLTFSACSEKEDEGELITTVKLSISVAAGTPMVHTWQDLDGPGGNAPILPDTITLGQITPGGNAYLGTLEFWNEQNGNKENITLEVQNEAHDHFVCYEVSSMTMPPTGLSISATDKDKNNLPIGLSTEWKPMGKDFGVVVVRLKHQPGIKNGTCAVGDTDVEVTFPYKVL
ncbi:MAG: hypothetical protein RL285_643 [Bacteroidota bacterium]|jgi:hypothetical protein|nr:hypothetical protein [Bacteroidota bacterium]